MSPKTPIFWIKQYILTISSLAIVVLLTKVLYIPVHIRKILLTYSREFPEIHAPFVARFVQLRTWWRHLEAASSCHYVIVGGSVLDDVMIADSPALKLRPIENWSICRGCNIVPGSIMSDAAAAKPTASCSKSFSHTSQLYHTNPFTSYGSRKSQHPFQPTSPFSCSPNEKQSSDEM